MFSSFRSMINSDTILSAALLIALLVSEKADAACRNIVALWDTEYMVLDPGTLATMRVGDLRWLGIHSGGIVTGSSLDRAVVLTGAFLRTNSEDDVFERIAYSEIFPPSPSPAILYLENLGEGLRAQEDIPVREIELGMRPNYSVQWADWIEENSLIREIYDHEQHYVVGHELLDNNFNVLRRWEPQVGYNLEYPNCTADNSIYFVGLSGVHVFDEQRETMYQLENLERENLRLVPIHTKNCKAVAFRDTPDEDPERGAVLIDVVTGALGPEFSVRKFSEFLLFDGGNRLLQQNMESRILFTRGGAKYMENPTPTNQFNLIDTTTGEVLLERTLETGTGVLSKEMLCDEETPLALVKDADVFYLIDPNTLEVVASKAVPKLWNGIYDVFE